MKAVMNQDTDYVHTHIVNYEPTSLALAEAVAMYQASDVGVAAARDHLRDVVEANAEEAGLVFNDDLTDAVDYAAMIQWEIEHDDEATS